jgi:EmrB/QacA subfamily drug resistance transporter
VALIGGRLFLPTSKDPTAPRLDPVGAVLSTAGLVAILWGLIEAPSKGWGSSPILTAFVLGLVVLSLFVAWELRSDHPMLEIRFFKNRRFSAANIAVTFVFFAMFGSGFLITQLLQNVLGYSALRAGFAMMPIAIPLMVLGPVSARLTERFGTKAMVAFGLAMVGTGLAWLSRIGLGDGYVHVIFPMLTLAIGMGLTMAPATESIMGSLPRNKAGIGSAMNDTTRQVGGALGVAVIGSVLASRYRPSVTKGLSSTALAKAAQLPGVAGDQARTALAALHDQVGAAKPLIDSAAAHGSPFPKGQADQILHAAHSAFLNGFGAAVLVGAGVAFLGALVALVFLPAHGTEPEPDAVPAGAGFEASEPSVLAGLEEHERVFAESVPAAVVGTEAATLVAEAIEDADRVPAALRAGAAPEG